MILTSGQLDECISAKVWECYDTDTAKNAEHWKLIFLHVFLRLQYVCIIGLSNADYRASLAFPSSCKIKRLCVPDDLAKRSIMPSLDGVLRLSAWINTRLWSRSSSVLSQPVGDQLVTPVIAAAVDPMSPADRNFFRLNTSTSVTDLHNLKLKSKWLKWLWFLLLSARSLAKQSAK